MIVELTKNEAMWIIEKAANACAEGELVISKFTAEQLEKDEFTRMAVSNAREIMVAIAKLGQKLATALEEELKTKE